MVLDGCQQGCLVRLVGSLDLLLGWVVGRGARQVVDVAAHDHLLPRALDLVDDLGTLLPVLARGLGQNGAPHDLGTQRLLHRHGRGYELRPYFRRQDFEQLARIGQGELDSSHFRHDIARRLGREQASRDAQGQCGE